jgi:hypothetical protein
MKTEALKDNHASFNVLWGAGVCFSLSQNMRYAHAEEKSECGLGRRVGQHISYAILMTSGGNSFCKWSFFERNSVFGKLMIAAV